MIARLTPAHTYHLRLRLVRKVESLHSFSLTTLAAVEPFIEELEAEGETALAALLNLSVANSVGPDQPYYQKVRFGYILAAFDLFKAAEMPTVCHHMKAAYPSLPTPPNCITFPDFSPHSAPVPPQLSRAPASNDTSETTSREARAKENKSDPLDALT
jgi:hypothetical protein